MMVDNGDISLILLAMFFNLLGSNLSVPESELIGTNFILLYILFAFDIVGRRYTHHISTLRI